MEKRLLSRQVKKIICICYGAKGYNFMFMYINFRKEADLLEREVSARGYGGISVQ